MAHRLLPLFASGGDYARKKEDKEAEKITETTASETDPHRDGRKNEKRPLNGRRGRTKKEKEIKRLKRHQ